MSNKNLEPMLEMYVFETTQLVEQLEEILLKIEQNASIDSEDVEEIFRIVHTVKGSSSMMMFSNITALSHSIEDLFCFVREYTYPLTCCAQMCELLLPAIDFIRTEVTKMAEGKEVDGEEGLLVDKINQFLLSLKAESQEELKDKGQPCEDQIETPQKFYISQYQANQQTYNRFIIDIFFEEDCQMENIRAFTVLHHLKAFCSEICHYPQELFDNEESVKIIAKNGFKIYCVTSHTYEEIKENIQSGLFIKSLTLEHAQEDEYDEEIQALFCDEKKLAKSTEQIVDVVGVNKLKEDTQEEKGNSQAVTQNIISVNIKKLDSLMNLVGEIVITESMVTKNTDLEGLSLESFNKSARQLRKLTDELQDIVMAIRMVPIAPTFHKMNRVVRDIAKKLGKDVELLISGEETEVDKRVIDALADPLMHLVRNAVDHGIEEMDIRKKADKPQKASIRLNAFNAGGDVIVQVSDDGKGIDREKVIQKAREKNLTTKTDEQISDKEAFSFIILPGFSTKETATSFSGRGVGMDVVKKNIEKVGGSILIESVFGKGTTIVIKIPLTLTIIDGMQIRTGNSIYTLPIVSIKESFKVNQEELLKDIQGNEMVMIRGNCYPIIRLHRYFNTTADTKDLCEGIMIMVEANGKAICLFADELLGEQQVVVKPLPTYLMQYGLKERGVSGCTILGEGTISLMMDVAEIINKTMQGGD